MKVSVIVPVFNVVDYVDKCIESILKQTFQDYELIIVNDGSTDGSEQKCREWEKKSHNIVFVSQNNRGVSAARNEGLSISKGEYVAFVDGDDYVEPNYLEEMVNCAEENQDAEIILCGYKYDDSGEVSEYGFFSENKSFDRTDRISLICRAIGVYEEDIKRKTHVGTPWAKLYSRKFLTDNKIVFDEDMPRMQDLIFNICCFNNLTKGIYINMYLYCYVVRNDSTVNKFKPAYEKDALQIINKLISVTEKYDDEYVRESVRYKTILLLIEAIRLQYIKKECRLNYFKKIREIRRICSKEPFSSAISLPYKCIKNSYARELFLSALKMQMFDLAYLMVKVKHKGK